MVFQGYLCCACDPNVYLDANSIGVVCVCQKLSPHLRVRMLGHRCFTYYVVG